VQASAGLVVKLKLKKEGRTFTLLNLAWNFPPVAGGDANRLGEADASEPTAR